jgi:hypothetical protein
MRNTSTVFAIAMLFSAAVKLVREEAHIITLDNQ